MLMTTMIELEQSSLCLSNIVVLCF